MAPEMVILCIECTMQKYNDAIFETLNSVELTLSVLNCTGVDSSVCVWFRRCLLVWMLYALALEVHSFFQVPTGPWHLELAFAELGANAGLSPGRVPSTECMDSAH